VAQESLILLRSFIQRLEMLGRDYQKMHRRLRVEISNDDTPIIFMNCIARNFTVDNPAKQATLF
jgi:hypothetical protein